MNKLLADIKTLFTKEYWKSNPQVQSNVSIWRRLSAFILDSFIALAILIQFSLLIDPHNSSDLGFTIWLGSIFLYFILDYWLLPNKTGFTTSRWICGYQILESNGLLPRIRTLFKRGITLWLINFLTIDLASLLSILFRKDKRAIHDIYSNTKTVHSKKHHAFLRLGIFVFLVVFLFLGVIKLGLKKFSSTFVTPQIESLEEEWKSKSSVIYLTEIPIEKGDTKYQIENSKFYIQNGENEILATDSGISFNDVYIRVKTSKTRINFAKDYNTLTWLPLNSFFIKIFSRWTSEELFRLTLEETNINLLKRLPLTQPIKNIKRVYGNYFLSVINRNYKNAVQQGMVHSPSSGFYALIASDKYNIVTFDLLEADTINRIVFALPKDRKDIAMYLLNNTGIDN